MAAADPFRQIDAAIAHHFASIDQHRIEIQKLQESRELLETLQHQTVDQPVAVHRIEGRKSASSVASPLRITVQREGDGGEQANGQDLNGHVDRRRGKRPRPRAANGARKAKPGSFAEKVEQWFAANPKGEFTSGFLLEKFGARDKREKQHIYQALFACKQRGDLVRNESGGYSRA